MDMPSTAWSRPRFWIALAALVILLITLYFYDPFTTYLAESIPNIRLDNVIFWFASLVGVVAFAISHWQSFKRNILRESGGVNVDALVFESLQITLLTAVIFSAGATLQAVGVLGEYLMSRGAIIDAGFGQKALAIIILVIITIALYLLHLVVQAIRGGWSSRAHPTHRRGPSSGPAHSS